MRRVLPISLLLFASVSLHCSRTNIPTPMKQPFGTADGKEVTLYTLRSETGMEATIATYGGTIVSLKVPDRNGVGDVVLGYDSLSSYVAASPYFGCLIGRYGNRIARGKFTLDGQEYSLATNNGVNHLHGGMKGFDKVVWTVDSAASAEGSTLVLTYVSRDGEEGYPGTLSIRVTYTLKGNELGIAYEATTDAPTIVNLTQHSYFSLAGPGEGDILGHELMIAADRFTPIDSTLIPTGELRDVAGTPFDFRTPVRIGARIGETNEQLTFGLGYDHNWVLSKEPGYGLAARVTEPVSGRVMEVYTTEPGLQFYSGNFLDGTNIGKGGKAYRYRYGFCLETQHYPDSPNQKAFPTTVLRPGEKYATRTAYRFSVAGK